MRSPLIILAVLSAAAHAVADFGSIPYVSQARILEPNQRALVAFNGREELLILSTDLRADRDTKVLEVIPFPSEPVVKEADVSVFVRATHLINKKLASRRKDSHSFGDSDFGDSFGPEIEPAGRVTFHEKIGAHELVVVHVEHPDKFVEWVESYLKRQGVGAPEIPEPLRVVIAQYISENFTWFVFDVISLSKKPVTKEAIQFRFATTFLYYPMRITRTEIGDTTVQLLIVSSELFKDWMCLGLPRKQIRMVHRPVRFTEKEVRWLGDELFEMLGQPGSILVRNWRVVGRLDSFSDDIIVGPPRAFIRHLRSGQQPNRGDAKQNRAPHL